VETLGRVLVTATFLSDPFIDLVMRFFGHTESSPDGRNLGALDSFGSFAHLLLSLVEFAGAVIIIKYPHHKVLPYVVGTLVFSMLTTPLLGGLWFDLDMWATCVSVCGGLLLVYVRYTPGMGAIKLGLQEVDELEGGNERKQLFAPDPISRMSEADRVMLVARAMLACCFLTHIYSVAHFSGWNSVPHLTIMGIGSVLIILGFRATYSTRLLALVLAGFCFYMFPFWQTFFKTAAAASKINEATRTSAKLSSYSVHPKDFYSKSMVKLMVMEMWHFSHCMSIVGGLLLLSLYGPGKHSLDAKKKGTKKSS